LPANPERARLRIRGTLQAAAKQAKDCGSAAVMLSLVVAGIVWLAFLVQRLGG